MMRARKKMSSRLPLLLMFALWSEAASSQRSVPLPAPPPSGARTERRTPIVEAVERIGPAVVNISAEKLVQRRRSSLDSFFGFDARPRGYKTESLGSGVILDASGIVVTDDHAISGASRIWVTTADGRELEAKLEGADADNALAVGPSNTVTTGIVSAVHRTVKGESGRNYSDFLQTDAAINPGNSGGALVNVLGELIGINTAIVGGANTIGFAIPIDRARRVVNELLHYGEVKSVWLGLRGTSVSLGTDRPLRPGARGQGLRVRSVYPHSPAARSGADGPPHDRTHARRPRPRDPAARARGRRTRHPQWADGLRRHAQLARRRKGDRSGRPASRGEQPESEDGRGASKGRRRRILALEPRALRVPGAVPLQRHVRAGIENFNSDRTIPARTSAAPAQSRPVIRSPRNRAAKSAVKTGSRAKRIAAWVADIRCCAHVCARNVTTVAARAIQRMAAATRGVSTSARDSAAAKVPFPPRNGARASRATPTANAAAAICPNEYHLTSCFGAVSHITTMRIA